MGNREKVVVIRDLYKAFGELEVLKGVDLDLYREENLVVLGRSGTGKSVLIKIMVGLLQQDSGSMEVLGKEISKLGIRDLNEMRLKIGFSFQNSALYDSMTVRENMEFPLVRNIKNLTKKKLTFESRNFWKPWDFHKQSIKCLLNCQEVKKENWCGPYLSAKPRNHVVR